MPKPFAVASLRGIPSAVALCLLVWAALLVVNPDPVQSARPDAPALSSRSNSPYLADLIAEARRLRLWEERLWHLLLHYRPNWLTEGVTSEADGPGFFNHPQGKFNPQAELEATLARFFGDEILAPGNQTPQCTFPARFEWLDSHLHFDPARLPRQPCPRFERWRAALDPESVSLIFASHYFNNPASMFGHTLLVLNKKGRPENERLLNYAINYAAVIGADESALSYAYLGLSGGFRGYFSIMPYYLKVKEYNDMESRDLWEFELNFSQPQIDRLVRHAWELGSTYFDYFFFKENCSYHLLSLLEVADPNLRLRDDFLLWTLPTDTVRKVLEYPGVLRQTTYRPSRGSQLSQKLDQLEPEGNRELIRVIHDPEVIESPQFRERAPEQQALILDAAVDYYRYTSAKDDPERKSPARETLRNFLLARSRLHVQRLPVENTPQSEPPQEGHDTAWLMVGGGQTGEDAAFLEVGLQPAFHNLLSRETAYARNSQIKLLSGRVRHDFEEETTRLENFTLVDLTSITPMRRLFRSFSWRLRGGWERNRDGACASCTPFTLNGGLGAALETGLLNREVYFGFVEVFVEGEQDFRKGYRLGGGASLGILVDVTDNWRSALIGRTIEFTRGEEGRVERAAFQNRYSLTENLELKLDLAWVNDYREAFLALGVYF